MRKLERFDIMDYVQCEEKRAEVRRNGVKQKKARRLFLGERLLFLFENTDIVRAHIFENISHGKLFSEHDLIRQLEVFNQLIAEPGELRCTMIIFGNADCERAKRIKLWKGLPSHIYLVLRDGRKIHAQAPEIPMVNQHPCSMRVLKFACGNQYPVKIGSDYSSESEYQAEAELSISQQRALREDLAPSHKAEDYSSIQ